MAFLEAEEITGLRIKNMIVHVVGKKLEFVPQPVLDPGDQASFFLSRVIETDISSVHKFHPKSAVKALVEGIASNKTSFEHAAQELSRTFSKDHVGASKAGAFFIFELETDVEGVLLYSFMKYDYKEAVELYEKDGQNAFRQIIQALIRDRKAIQKSALLRSRSGVLDADVSAKDRMGTSPDLTDFYQTFLDIHRERDNTELSRSLNEALRSSFDSVKDSLPAGGIPAAVAAAKDLLRNRETIDDDAIKEAVFVAAGRPKDEEIKDELERSVDRQLKRKRISGVSFKPDPEVLQRRARRRIKTAEGVLIEFPGEQEGNVVTRTDDTENGSVITIRTSKKLAENDVVADRTGNQAR